jgi:hypothetical protein
LGGGGGVHGLCIAIPHFRANDRIVAARFSSFVVRWRMRRPGGVPTLRAEGQQRVNKRGGQRTGGVRERALQGQDASRGGMNGGEDGVGDLVAIGRDANSG